MVAIDKLLDLDLSKLNPGAIKKVAAAVVQDAKGGERETSSAVKALDSVASAKSAMKASEKDISGIED